MSSHVSWDVADFGKFHVVIAYYLAHPKTGTGTVLILCSSHVSLMQHVRSVFRTTVSTVSISV